MSYPFKMIVTGTAPSPSDIKRLEAAFEAFEMTARGAGCPVEDLKVEMRALGGVWEVQQVKPIEDSTDGMLSILAGTR